MSTEAWVKLGVLAFLWAGQCVLGVYVASAKRRSLVAGFLMGMFLGVIGALILALLPAKPEPRKAKRRDTVGYYGWKPMDEEEETVGDWIAKPNS